MCRLSWYSYWQFKALAGNLAAVAVVMVFTETQSAIAAHLAAVAVVMVFTETQSAIAAHLQHNLGTFTALAIVNCKLVVHVNTLTRTSTSALRLYCSQSTSPHDSYMALHIPIPIPHPPSPIIPIIPIPIPIPPPPPPPYTATWPCTFPPLRTPHDSYMALHHLMSHSSTQTYAQWRTVATCT